MHVELHVFKAAGSGVLHFFLCDFNTELGFEMLFPQGIDVYKHSTNYISIPSNTISQKLFSENRSSGENKASHLKKHKSIALRNQQSASKGHDFNG